VPPHRCNQIQPVAKYLPLPSRGPNTVWWQVCGHYPLRGTYVWQISAGCGDYGAVSFMSSPQPPPSRYFHLRPTPPTLIFHARLRLRRRRVGTFRTKLEVHLVRRKWNCIPASTRISNIVAMRIAYSRTESERLFFFT